MDDQRTDREGSGMKPSWMGDHTPHRLKLTGYTSASEVESIFDSSMIDIAYIERINDDEIVIFADDPKWPENQNDCDWLRDIVTQTLADYGITGIAVTYFITDEFKT